MKRGHFGDNRRHRSNSRRRKHHHKGKNKIKKLKKKQKLQHKQSVKNTKLGKIIKINLNEFLRDEVVVSVSGQTLNITAKHNLRDTTEHEVRHSYQLAEGTDVKNISSQWKDNGKLSVFIPKCSTGEPFPQ